MTRAFFALALAVSLHAATPLYQTSIDKPQSYAVLRGAAKPDPDVLHNNNKSLRVEAAKAGTSAAVVASPPSTSPSASATSSPAGSAPTTSASAILDRSPIATGATLSMASMPFDVHSASLGGTQPWTRLSLKFTASRSQDEILLTVGNGGAFARARRGSKASASMKSAPAMPGPRAKPCRRSAPPTAIPPPAGSISTSKASPTSAAISTAT